MREIKFRGKRIDSEEWVYGYYVKSRGRHYILQLYDLNGYDERWEKSSWVEVIPETVGQYAGLEREIYEGDILKIETANHKLINVVCKYGIVRRFLDTGWEVDIPSFYFERKDLKSFPIVKNWCGKHDLEIIEIIGNIYEGIKDDNKETKTDSIQE